LEEIVEMVHEAALLHPQNRSIGWDIVVTEKGPGFIEGNHDWCKLLWQLPEKKGMKSILESYKNHMYSEFFKRIFDFLFSLAVILSLLLPLLVIVVLIKAESKGPLFLGKSG
jgi:hypothetical protein